MTPDTRDIYIATIVIHRAVYSGSVWSSVDGLLGTGFQCCRAALTTLFFPVDLKYNDMFYSFTFYSLFFVDVYVCVRCSVFVFRVTF